MSLHEQKTLSRREQQVMEIVYRLEKATAAQVLEHLPDPPSYSAVRSLLSVLEEKGHLQHIYEGQRYIYSPVIERDKAKFSAMKKVLQTFFNNSIEQAVAALLDISKENMSEEELKRTEQLIRQAKNEEHKK